MASAETVRIYRPAKIAALIIAGHEPKSMLMVGIQLHVYFLRTPKFDADCIAFDALKVALKDIEHGSRPCNLGSLAQAIAEARNTR